METQRNKEDFLDGLNKLLKEEWQTDVLLKAGYSDQEGVSAHKLVLAGRSKVFKKMFESDELKTSPKVETVTLSEMKHEQLKALVEFMYSVDGSISLKTLKTHGWSLYIAGDKYEIMYLRDLCRTHLKSSLNTSNALNILALAQIPYDKVLDNAAFSTIITNIHTIANSAEFNSFVFNHPNLSVKIVKALLTRPYNYTDSVCQVLFCITVIVVTVVAIATIRSNL